MKIEYKRINGDVREAREYEAMLAENHQLKADLVYIAMMADVDLDETTEDMEG